MKCPICNHETQLFEVQNRKNRITFYSCTYCECVFKSPIYHQDLITQKERYDLHQNNKDDCRYQAYFQNFLDFVLPYVDESKRAFDFGCGATTLLADMLQNNGFEVDFFDPIYYPKRPKTDKCYDLVVTTEVFEHLHHPKDTFKELVGYLDDHGYLAIQTQFHPNEKEKFNKWYYHLDPTHVVFFTIKTFVTLCSLYGCHIVADNGKNIVIIKK